MSYDTAQQYSPEGVFSGGYADNTPDYTLKDKYSPYSRNIRIEGLATVSRPGHSLLTTFTATDGAFPLGIGSYLRFDPDGDRLVVRHNITGTQKLWTIEEDGNRVAVTTGANITSDNRMNFQNIGEVIYCMNGSDDFGRILGTTYSTPNTGLADFAPAYSVVFNGSHFASGWSDEPNTVFKSKGDLYEEFSGDGSDQLTFQETITGLATTSQALFYFTKNSISVTGVGDITDSGTVISYTTRSLTVKEGAINHNSIVTAGNKLYCLTPSNKIIEVGKGQGVDGFDVDELSERENRGISEIMSTLDADQTESFGYFLHKENLIKWFVKTKGATFNDLCIIYDVTKDAFLVDDGKYFYGGVSFKGNSYTISMLEPKIYQDEFGYDDEDSAINFRYETKQLDLGLFSTKKELWELISYVAINSLAVLTQTIEVDGGIVDVKVVNNDNIPDETGGIGTFPIGTAAIGTGGGFLGRDLLERVTIRRTKGNLQNKGYRIKVIYTNSTIAGRVRLEGLNMRVELLPELANSLT